MTRASRLGAPADLSQHWGRFARTGAFALVLLAYANISAWAWARRSQNGASGSQRSISDVNVGHLWMLALTLGWAAVERVTPAQLGLGRGGAVRSLASGLLVGVAGFLAVLGAFWLPPVRDRAAAPPELRGLSGRQLVGLLSGQFLLGSAVFEEVAFRGLLHAQLVRLMGVWRGIIAGAGLFAAWHVLVTWYNLRHSPLPRRLFPWLYAGILGVLFGAGLLLGLLRHATGHVLGGILAHWLTLAGVLLGVTRLIRRPDTEDKGGDHG